MQHLDPNAIPKPLGAEAGIGDWEEWLVRLRRRQRLLAIWAMSLFVSFGAGMVTNYPGGIWLWTLAWLLSAAAVGLVWDRIRCPRCRQKFYVADHWANALTSRCLHCGLAVEDIVALSKRRLAEKG